MKITISLPFAFAITIILSILKLIGVISWSWWIITAPIWFVPLLYVVIFSFIFAILFLISFIVAIFS